MKLNEAINMFIDDVAGVTLASASTRHKATPDQVAGLYAGMDLRKFY